MQVKRELHFLRGIRELHVCLNLFLLVSINAVSRTDEQRKDQA
jgi:hypothetical protein